MWGAALNGSIPQTEKAPWTRFANMDPVIERLWQGIAPHSVMTFLHKRDRKARHDLESDERDNFLCEQPRLTAGYRLSGSVISTFYLEDFTCSWPDRWHVSMDPLTPSTWFFVHEPKWIFLIMWMRSCTVSTKLVVSAQRSRFTDHQWDTTHLEVGFAWLVLVAAYDVCGR